MYLNKWSHMMPLPFEYLMNLKINYLQHPFCIAHSINLIAPAVSHWKGILIINIWKSWNCYSLWMNKHILIFKNISKLVHMAAILNHNINLVLPLELSKRSNIWIFKVKTIIIAILNLTKILNVSFCCLSMGTMHSEQCPDHLMVIYW